MCTTFGVLCMEALPVSPGSVGRVPREEFVAHVVSACVLRDLCVVHRVFRVLQCVKISALPPRCSAAPSPVRSKLCCRVERRAAIWSRRQWSISRRCTQPLGQRAPPRVFFVALAIASVGARRPGSSRQRTPSRNPRVLCWQAFLDGKPGVYLVLGAGVRGRGWRCRTS